LPSAPRCSRRPPSSRPPEDTLPQAPFHAFPRRKAPMLIITRRPGEKIMLGDDIVLHVMEIVGNSVRVGIQAPRSLPVYREEIWDAVREENRAAATAAPDARPSPARPAA